MCDSADPALFTFAVAQSFDRHIHKPWRNCFINQDSFTFSFDKNRFRGRKRENPTKKLNACLALFEYKDFLSTTFLFLFLTGCKPWETAWIVVTTRAGLTSAFSLAFVIVHTQDAGSFTTMTAWKRFNHSSIFTTPGTSAFTLFQMLSMALMTTMIYKMKSKAIKVCTRTFVGAKIINCDWAIERVGPTNLTQNNYSNCCLNERLISLEKSRWNIHYHDATLEQMLLDIWNCYGQKCTCNWFDSSNFLITQGLTVLVKSRRCASMQRTMVTPFAPWAQVPLGLVSPTLETYSWSWLIWTRSSQTQ